MSYSRSTRPTSLKKITEKHVKESSKLIQKFISFYKSADRAAKSLGCCYDTILRLSRGETAISWELAKRMEIKTKGQIRIEELMPWIFDHR